MKKFIAVIVLVTSLLTLSSCATLKDIFLPIIVIFSDDHSGLLIWDEAKLGTDIQLDKTKLTKDETVTINCSISPTDNPEKDSGRLSLSDDSELLKNEATVTISAYGFLITCGDKSARSYLEIEIPDVYKKVTQEDDTSDTEYYEPWFDFSFTLSDYKSEDSLGFIYFSAVADFHNTVSYAEGTQQRWRPTRTTYFSVTESENELIIANSNSSINKYGCGISVPPHINLYIRGAECSSGFGTFSQNYCWRGYDRKPKDSDTQIVEIEISRESVAKLQANNYEAEKFKVVYEIKSVKIYSYDLDYNDERLIQFSYDHKEKIATFTPEENRIFIFELEFEHGSAKYEVKFIPYDPSN